MIHFWKNFHLLGHSKKIVKQSQNNLNIYGTKYIK